jgi:hypothetical protein
MYGIAKGEAQRRQPVLTGIAINNFNFNRASFKIASPMLDSFAYGQSF